MMSAPESKGTEMANEYCPECHTFLGADAFEHCPQCGAKFDDDDVDHDDDEEWDDDSDGDYDGD